METAMSLAAVEDDAICLAVNACRALVSRVSMDGGSIRDALDGLERLYLETAWEQRMPGQDGTETTAEAAAFRMGEQTALIRVIAQTGVWRTEGRQVVDIDTIQRMFVRVYLAASFHEGREGCWEWPSMT